GFQKRLVGGRVPLLVRRIGAQDGRQIGEQVRALRAPEGAFRVDATVVQAGMVLQLPPDEVAAVGDARGERLVRAAAVMAGHGRLGGAGQLGQPAVPFDDGVAGPAAVLVELRAAVALVGRGVGIALGEDPVGNREVVGVLAPVAGRTGDDEAAVPFLRETDDELGVVVPAVVGVERAGVGEIAVYLDAGHARGVAGAGRVE